MIWLQVLHVADEDDHINKPNVRIPFVCGCRNLNKALRHIGEGARARLAQET